MNEFRANKQLSILTIIGIITFFIYKKTYGQLINVHLLILSILKKKLKLLRNTKVEKCYSNSDELCNINLEIVSTKNNVM